MRVEGAAPPVTVVVLADYLGHDSYTKEGHLYPFLSSLKRNSAVLRAPGTQLEVFPTASDLCTCPLEKSIRKTQVQKEKKAKKSGANANELVQHLANVLKKINPHKQKSQGTVYLSLKD